MHMAPKCYAKLIGCSACLQIGIQPPVVCTADDVTAEDITADDVTADDATACDVTAAVAAAAVVSEKSNEQQIDRNAKHSYN